MLRVRSGGFTPGRGRQSRAFTLIELLVVIAIIAILAAMLFPVFARARESARKIQCLSNVKNIAMAFQIYLSDYDAFPPDEHRQEAINYFDGAPGGGSAPCWGAVDQATNSNPYLRWPVILDEYVKNRDVWRCPSAKLSNVVVNVFGQGDWLAQVKANEGRWGLNGASDVGYSFPCGSNAFPPGWGGTVTDMFAQNTPAGEETASFEFGYGWPARGGGYGRKLSTITDSSNWVVLGDANLQARADLISPIAVAFPDVCRAQCGSTEATQGAGSSACCISDWTNCSWTQDCGLNGHSKYTFWADPSYRKKYARHLGGSNLGFADGHASWMPADAIIAASPGGRLWSGNTRPGAKLQGWSMCACEYGVAG